MDRSKLTNKLSAYFSTREDIAFAYLFGSAATDRATAESDVDIAVYFRDTAPNANVASSPHGGPNPGLAPSPHATPEVEEIDHVFEGEDQIWADLEKLSESSVDLVVLNRASVSIAAGAMLNGSLVHSSDDYLRTSFVLAVTARAEEQREFVEDFVKIKARSKSLSDIDRTRLVRIVDFLEDELVDADRFAEMDIERYSVDRDFRRLVERWVENLVNASIDAAKIVLASERRPVPHTYRETVADLATVKGFEQHREVIRRLATNTRVRNMLAHEYLDLRYTRVDEVVDHAAQTYGTLVCALRDWMGH